MRNRNLSENNSEQVDRYDAWRSVFDYLDGVPISDTDDDRGESILGLIERENSLSTLKAWIGIQGTEYPGETDPDSWSKRYHPQNTPVWMNEAFSSATSASYDGSFATVRDRVLTQKPRETNAGNQSSWWSEQ